MPYADKTSPAARASRKAASKRHYDNHRESEVERAARWAREHREHVARTSVERRSQRTPVEVVLWRNAKNRSTARGIPFSITVADISVPAVCPILGIPLVVGTGHARPNSPPLDRRNPTKGYVPGNVAVISHKANTIKSNATAEELRRVLAYLEDP